MAISKNLLLKQLSGHLDKLIVFKQYGDTTVVGKYPDMSRRKLSEKQKQVNENMADATYRALGIIGNEELRNAAQIRLNVTRNKLYTALIKEHFKNLKEPGGK
jgi:hypothetical protein